MELTTFVCVLLIAVALAFNFWRIQGAVELVTNINGKRRYDNDDALWGFSFRSPDDVVAQLPAIRNALSRSDIPSDEIDDMANDIVVIALKALKRGDFIPDPGLEPDEAFRRWLKGIARNRVKEYRRAARRRIEISNEIDRRDPDPLKRLEARSDLAAIGGTTMSEGVLDTLVDNGEGKAFAIWRPVQVFTITLYGTLLRQHAPSCGLL